MSDTTSPQAAEDKNVSLEDTLDQRTLDLLEKYILSVSEEDRTLNEMRLQEELEKLDPDYREVFRPDMPWSTINDKKRYKEIQATPDKLDMMQMLSLGYAEQTVTLFKGMEVTFRSLSSADVAFAQLWYHLEQSEFERAGSKSDAEGMKATYNISPNSDIARGLALSVKKLNGKELLNGDPIELYRAGRVEDAITFANAARAKVMAMDQYLVLLLDCHMTAFNDRVQELYNPDVVKDF